MYNLLRQKKSQLTRLVTVVILLIASEQVFAQRELNLPNHDDKKYYLGIGLVYNMSRFGLSHHPQFLAGDSIMVVEPENTGGFGLAGMHTYRLSPRFEVRAIFPQLLFSYKNLTYHLKYPDPAKDEQPIVTKRVESILLGLPIHLKFRSDRINNFRVYMFGGVKADIDMASNARAKRAEDLVKIKKYDKGIEFGVGFNFFMESFIFSPEIKISNGLGNIHSRDANLKYSSVFDKIQSRMIVFSIHLEG